MAFRLNIPTSKIMRIEKFMLRNNNIRLEPLNQQHLNEMVNATAAESELYRWSAVPIGLEQSISYIAHALSSYEKEIAIPFAIVRESDNKFLGSTRFFDLGQFDWPPGNRRYSNSMPDVCEIGYTWLTPAAIRSFVNTTCKLLMLTHAFEVWNVIRVCFHTDERNLRSRTALERIGGNFEGILRAHRMGADHTARNSARYSIMANEWQSVKSKLILSLKSY